MTSTSASNYITLLNETDHRLHSVAIKRLNQSVNLFWVEIAEPETIKRIEELSEDISFPEKELASLLVSKVLYHLGDYKNALNFALGAGDQFDLTDETEFVRTIRSICIDVYTSESLNNIESEIPVEIDDRLEQVISRLFEKCFNDSEYKQVIGIALQCRRLDIIERAVKEGDSDELLSYIFDVSRNLHREFRKTVLAFLVKLYDQHDGEPDFVNMVRCLTFLNDSDAIVEIFIRLLQSGNDDSVLLAYQMAFELVDSATQQFVATIRRALGDDENSTDPFAVALQTLGKILTGEPTIQFYLDFLYSANNTDMRILKKIKSLFEPKTSTLHQATVLSNALMHCGTTRDTFLRKNLEWVSRAQNWAKFTTTAGLGVIHKGHLKEAMNVLDPYLPKPGVEASPYIEGGSLFALGLIYANHGEKISSYLLEHLRNIDLQGGIDAQGNAGANLEPEKKREIVQHGAALGLGVAGMASQNRDACKALMNLLYQQDSAIAGEAAGVSLGLVMLGSGTNEFCQEMLNFAHSTSHEKIIRGLSLGLALMMYSREEEAESLISHLTDDQDPILRYGGMHMIGLAYCGTSNNGAISRLLHVAVSDVNDDVRRSAVINLGFVLFRRPDEVPKLVSLLAASYNPHVRYGAALALGIGCAGSGMSEAIDILLPLSKDKVPFVRQGAWIALSMVLIQISEKEEPRVHEIRESMLDVVGKKTQSIMARFGAVLGLGIIDAGGRNSTISLSSTVGHMNMNSIAGITVFLQHWYWYPYINFLSLAFTPTAVVAINKNLQMPQYLLKSNAPPSMFRIPEKIQVEEKEELEKLPVAELSTTKKTKLRKGKESGDAMAVDEEVAETETEPEKEDDKMEVDEKVEEEQFELLNNPARVTRKQLRYISFDVDPRYSPITEGVHGVILLKDSTPEEEENIIITGVPTLEVTDDFGDEPTPPEPFTFLG